MSGLTWCAGAIAGVLLVALVWMAFVAGVDADGLPQLIAIAALFLGFTLTHSSMRTIEELQRQSSMKEASKHSAD